MNGALACLAGLVAGAAVLLWPSAGGPEWTPAHKPWHSASVGRWGSSGGRRTGLSGSPSASSRSLVPEALELVALALLGGGSLAAAVSRVGGVLSGEPGRELEAVGGRLQDGTADADAWDEAGDRWAAARRSLRLAQVAGVAPGQALTRSAHDLRRDAVSHVEVAAARLGVRLVLPLGLAYLPAFVLTTVLPVVLALTRDLAW